MKKRLYAFLCSIWFFLPASQAQIEANYSQLINQLGIINPSYNAVNRDFEVDFLYRNQWTGFSGAPKSMGINAHGGLPWAGLGAGVNINMDQIGARNNTLVGANVNIEVRLFEKSYLMAGIFAGADMWRYNTLDEISYEGDVILAPNKTKPALAFGLTYLWEGLIVGGSIRNIFRDSHYSEDPHATSYYAHAEYLLRIRRNWSLKPMVLYSHSTIYNDMLDAGLMAGYLDRFFLGSIYRMDRSVSVFTHIHVLPYLSLSYSYDINTKKTLNIDAGSHEIGLSFNLSKLLKLPEGDKRELVRNFD